MINKIFVDMDGVLADFNSRFVELFGHPPSESRNKFGQHWRTLVDDKHFENFDLHEGATELVEFLNSVKHRADIAILSSSGGFKDHASVQSQKIKWLCKNNIVFPAIIVPGRWYKKGFASITSFLIDDTKDVCEDFEFAGGLVSLHTNAKETIDKLKVWLNL